MSILGHLEDSVDDANEEETKLWSMFKIKCMCIKMHEILISILSLIKMNLKIFVRGQTIYLFIECFVVFKEGLESFENFNL